jgi:hypothetical protein
LTSVLPQAEPQIRNPPCCWADEVVVPTECIEVGIYVLDPAPGAGANIGVVVGLRLLSIHALLAAATIVGLRSNSPCPAPAWRAGAAQHRLLPHARDGLHMQQHAAWCHHLSLRAGQNGVGVLKHEQVGLVSSCCTSLYHRPGGMLEAVSMA